MGLYSQHRRTYSGLHALTLVVGLADGSTGLVTVETVTIESVESARALSASLLSDSWLSLVGSSGVFCSSVGGRRDVSRAGYEIHQST
jgi:hypothetical protein